MKLIDLTKDVEARVDDAPAMIDMLRWMQAAQNRLATSVGAKFPNFIDENGQYNQNDAPVFDEKYHEALVLFACARYKESDSSLKESERFDSQFEEVKKEFIENYEVPEYYRDDRTSQQFVATSGQTDFTITKQGYSPRYGDLKLYVNNLRRYDFEYDLNGPTFTMNNALVSGDKVTAVWEEHQDLTEAPYSWWRW